MSVLVQAARCFAGACRMWHASGWAKILQRGKLSLAAEQRNVAYLMSVTRTSPGNVGHGYRHLSLLRMSCISGHVASAYPAVNASWRRPSHGHRGVPPLQIALLTGYCGARLHLRVVPRRPTLDHRPGSSAWTVGVVNRRMTTHHGPRACWSPSFELSRPARGAKTALRGPSAVSDCVLLCDTHTRTRMAASDQCLKSHAPGQHVCSQCLHAHTHTHTAAAWA